MKSLGPLTRKMSMSETHLTKIKVPGLNQPSNIGTSETSFMGSRNLLPLSRRQLYVSKRLLYDSHMIDDQDAMIGKQEKIVSFRLRLWRSLHYVARTTSFHGVPHLMAGRSMYRTLYWSVLLLTALAIMSVAIAYITREYFGRETTYSETVRFPDNLEFPAVTICSHNPYNDKNYKQYPIEVQVAIEYEFYQKDRLLESSNEHILQQLEEAFNISSLTFDSSYSIRTVLLEHGHRFKQDEGFFHCKFDDQKCSLNNFTESVTAFGLCSTFNLDGAAWNVSSAGRSHGLELTLDINQNDYLYYTSHTAGIQVFIHSQDEYPYSGEFHGFSVPPGFETQVAVSLTNTKRMKPPYGQCGDRPINDPYILPCENDEDGMMECPPPIKRYTRQRCLDECEAIYQNKMCGCKADYLPGNHIHVCDLNMLFRCLLNVAEQFARIKKEFCDCPLECNEKKYSIRISQSYYPANQYSQPLQDRYYGTISTQSAIRADLISLLIYYDQLDYREVTEKEKYSTFQYIADIGGHLGLFTGAGVLTFFELFELFFATLYPVEE